MRKPTIWVSDQSEINQALQYLLKARSLKLDIIRRWTVLYMWQKQKP